MTEREMPLGYLFKLIHDKFKKKQDQALACQDLTFSQLSVIIYLGDHRGEKVTQSDIVKELELKHSTIIGILQRLEAKNMVVCMVDPENKKYRNISMTEKAWKSFDQVVEHRKGMDDMLINSLTAEEAVELRRLLCKVLDSFEE